MNLSINKLMNDPRISLIAAISENRAIGNENKLLWNIPEDLQRFVKLTTGHPVIMGRRTFESIGHPLVNRMNIIVTRNQNYRASGCTVAHSLEEAIDIAKKEKFPPAKAGSNAKTSTLRVQREASENEIFIIGGGQIYEQAMKYANKLYLTVVKGNFKANTYFPDYSEFTKVISQEEKHSGDYIYTFLDLERGR